MQGKKKINVCLKKIKLIFTTNLIKRNLFILECQTHFKRECHSEPKENCHTSYQKSCKSVQKGETCHKVTPIKLCNTVMEEKKTYRKLRPMCVWPAFPESTVC